MQQAQGKFITLEGGEGAGKSTLIGLIERYFESNKLPMKRTCEPGGGTETSKEIRETLLKSGRILSSKAELLLYEASRAEHVEFFIRPELLKGTNILCDRFTTSSLAYQGYARGIDLKFIEELNSFATGGLEPDLILWLRINPEKGLERVKSRGELSRLDAEKLEFHKLVFDGFETIARNDSERFIILDALKSPSEILDDLISHPKWKKLFP